MERFRADGHLTDEALEALIHGVETEPLGRLELAEHLSFCDLCLQRYTDRLTGGSLLTPEHSCRNSLWRRLRQRTLRVLTSRYATAAAAVALALSMVWSDVDVSACFTMQRGAWEQVSAVMESLRDWPKWWEEAGLRQMTIQGGENP